MITLIEGIAIGYVAGAFTPSIGRTIKSWFSKEATVVKTDITAEAKTVETDIAKKV